MENEQKVKIEFVVPKPTDPGAARRKMAILRMTKVMAQVQSIKLNPTDAVDQFDILENAMMENYRWLASFIKGCTPEQALSYIMDDCSDEQLDQMQDELAKAMGMVSDPKEPENQPASTSTSEETSAAP